ncbi:cytochrome P450 family protein [Streptomyces daliensis]
MTSHQPREPRAPHEPHDDQAASPSPLPLPASGPVPLTVFTQAQDPHPLYRRLRATHGPVAPVLLEPGVTAWLVMGVEEIRVITEREKLYSRDARNWRDLDEGRVPPDSGLMPMMAYRPNVVGADLKEHRRLRGPLDDGVARFDHRTLRRQVRRRCETLIDGFAERGWADLMGDYAAHVPMLALAALFGLDAAQGHELHRALIALFGSQDDSQEGNRTFEEILRDTLHARQRQPTDDLTSAFLSHHDLRTEDEVLQSMAAMISAGNEATTCWIAHTLYRVITDPAFEARLRGGDLGVDEALDEVLWHEPPMTHMPARYALRDTELGGRRIRRGDCLVLGLNAANATDPRLPPLDRRPPGNRGHAAFSAGPHMCPAQDAARLITHTAVNTVLHRLPGLRLTIGPEEVTFNPSPWTRRPTTLPVVFSTPLRRTPSARRDRARVRSGTPAGSA